MINLTAEPINRIEPCDDNPGTHKTGELRNITADEITAILGFEPNFSDDPDKVVHSWLGRFTYSDGERRTFAIWDYKGSHKDNKFSTWGDQELLNGLFHGHYNHGLGW